MVVGFATDVVKRGDRLPEEKEVTPPPVPPEPEGKQSLQSVTGWV
jgi:hypothetical protein